jgi:cytochrome c oxidase subunit 1
MKLQTAEEKSLGKVLVWMIVFPSILIVLGIYHGLMQTLFRAGIIRDSGFLGLDYYQGLTLHGVINAIVFTTFFAVAFGHAMVARFLKKVPNLALVWLSCILMTVGTVMAAIPVLLGEASVLYTFYPPLKAHWTFYLGATLLVVGSWVAFFSWIPVYLSWRRENSGQAAPLAVVGIFATFIVWMFATVPLAVDVLVLILPWSMGLVGEINVPLSRTLFWFFGHPLVYFWLLPAYVMYYVMMPKMAGGKLYSDSAARLAFMLFVVFSAPVGLHHQYTEPSIDASWKWFHALLTFGVAVPSFITAFTVAASLEHGSRKRGGRGLFGWWAKLPLFDSSNWLFSYLFVGLVLFLMGGITGIVNASVQMNNLVHNTTWVPAHFHTTVAGPVFLGFIGMSLFMVSKILGKPVHARRGAVWVPWLWLLGIAIFSTAGSINGIAGEPRRTNLGLSYLNPESSLFQPEWQPYAHMTALGGIIMFLACVVWFYCFFGTLFRKAAAEPALDFPVAEPLHLEQVGWVANFRPWVVVAVLLILLSYVPPIIGLSRGTFSKAPTYSPSSPAVQK